MLRTPDPETHPQFYEGVPLKRLLAWLVDVTLIALICVLLLPFTAFTGLFFFPLMMLVVGFAYRVITLSNGSATWGMRLMGMELRDQADAPLDFTTAFLHTSGYAVSMAMAPLQLISVVLMATSARCQGLTDMLLGTAALNRRLRD
ncbi:RDD family protein [Sulfitobacter aestuarii]|uniref:RDD family protein n=1 Tax=Sulfitobacter aestuarii TaxID=2161676 RepID=A0ABW5U1R2_9RHOB